ncbi:hypothetical protein [Lichenicoccus sp.]
MIGPFSRSIFLDEKRLFAHHVWWADLDFRGAAWTVGSRHAGLI